MAALWFTAFRELGRDDGDKAGRLRAVWRSSEPPRRLLVPADNNSPDNMTKPDHLFGAASV